MRNSHRILKNIFSLSAAEVINKGIVFITTAYLGRVLMPEGFGIISIANTYIVYFVLFVSYGFNVIGVREIAKIFNPDSIDSNLSNPNSKENSSIIKTVGLVNTILSIRILFAIICYIILFISVLNLDRPELYKQVILIAGLNLFSQAILLDWVWQGLEKMEILALRQGITSLLNLIGIFILVHNFDDTLLAMIVTTSSFAINAIWMFRHFIIKYGKFRFNFDFKEWKSLLISSSTIFILNIFISILTNFHLFMIGLTQTDEEMGYFTAAIKIYLLTMVSTTIIQNSFLPVLSRSDNNQVTNQISNNNIIEKYTLLLFITGAIQSLILYTFSDFITHIVFGYEYVQTPEILRILSLATVFVYISGSLIIPLLAWGKEKYVMISLGAGGTACFILNFIFVPIYGNISAAWITVIVEIISNLFLLYYFYKIHGKLYVQKIPIYLSIAGISCLVAYFMNQIGIPELICMIFAIILYPIINLIFKTISISEIRGYFSK